MPSMLYFGIIVLAIVLVTDRVSGISASLTITGAFLAWSIQRSSPSVYGVCDSSTHP